MKGNFFTLLGVTGLVFCILVQAVKLDQWNSLDIEDAVKHHNAIRACEQNLTRKENCRAEVVILEPGQKAVIVDAEGNRADCVHVSLGPQENRHAGNQGGTVSFPESFPRNPCKVE